MLVNFLWKMLKKIRILKFIHLFNLQMTCIRHFSGMYIVDYRKFTDMNYYPEF